MLKTATLSEWGHSIYANEPFCFKHENCGIISDMHGAYVYIFIVFQVLTLITVDCVCTIQYQIDNILVKYRKIRLCRGLNYWHLIAHTFDLGAFKSVCLSVLNNIHTCLQRY